MLFIICKEPILLSNSKWRVIKSRWVFLLLVDIFNLQTCLCHQNKSRFWHWPVYGKWTLFTNPHPIASDCREQQAGLETYHNDVINKSCANKSCNLLSSFSSHSQSGIMWREHISQILILDQNRNPISGSSRYQLNVNHKSSWTYIDIIGFSE